MMGPLPLLLAQKYQPHPNEWYFYTAYTLVWVLVLLYLVRLHLLIRDVLRRQAEQRQPDQPES